MTELIERAIAFAAALQERAIELQTLHERRQQAELDRMLQNPADKSTLVQITDQAFRAASPARNVDQFTHILDVQGVPRFFSPLDRAMLRGFQTFGAYLPGVAVPLVREHMQRETANVVLPAERDLLKEHLAQRRDQGLRMNVNFLGEAILSEPDAQRRLEQYLEALQLPETEVFSIKISTLYSQISSLAREQTIATLCDRIEVLYRTAMRSRFTTKDSAEIPKFIYLDMEEYRDMWLTAAVFMRTLNRPGLEHARAGIALQAYIPDSFHVLQEICAWARQRHARGHSPVTIRIVKGANMEMERVEASLRGWPQAPYKTKRETDANYKRLLHEVLRDENRPAINVGIASHNLFELGYAFALAESKNALSTVHFEMLEGMANAQRRALSESAKDVLLYAPVARKQDFTHAIGYLIRRLDENTGPENFLRHAFRLTVGSTDWRQLEAGFRDSVAFSETVSNAPRRTQNRNGPPPQPTLEEFDNEPDTDWSLIHNSNWAEKIISTWRGRLTEIPLVIDGAEVLPQIRQVMECGGPTPLFRECHDPSRPGLTIAHYRNATTEEIHQALACAAADPDGWRSLTYPQRHEILRAVAQQLRIARADLMGAALANAGKTLAESDPEVSEAIDFCEFYPLCARQFSELPNLTATGRGIVVVIPPWNFPIAIPCGGIAAALAAGNTVILKPASPAVLVAYELCQCFWRAGVSKRVLQFVPCAGDVGGQLLANDPRVSSVILTGGTDTALQMLRRNPALHLCAETGGKNATIVTALSDRDQAIKNVLHSAFSHSGQKCSATSLLLLEAEIYDDPAFKRALTEAAASITVGSAWDLKTKMGPMIHAPAGDLENALKTLDTGESWALMPRRVGDSPNLWTPGIKYGVAPGSYSHLTEFFGPVLSVVRFQKLSEAIALVNQTGYGLTSGLESLDEREQAEWKTSIRAGNLYINRPTTGAIVLRQPFGGLGKSSFGSGLKAGGPNYVAQFMRFTETAPSDINYDAAWRIEFSREHDHFRLLGEDNFRRYLPIPFVRIRVHPSDTEFQILARVAAASISGCRVTISYLEDSETIAQLHNRHETIHETDAQLIEAIRARQLDCLRYAAPDRVPIEIRIAAHEQNIPIIDTPVSSNGRLELLWYHHEQSISNAYHRYGNLGPRSDEPRRAVH